MTLSVDNLVRRVAWVGVVPIMIGVPLLPITGVTAAEEEGEPQLPETVELTGVLRDFKERTAPDGHPDFERRPDAGFGHYCGNIGPALGDDNKPVFQGGGWKVDAQYTDSGGQPICYTLFDESMGDQEGSQGVTDNGSITSAESLSQWFDDVPGVNVSMPLTITMLRQADGSYVFDDTEDPVYSDRGGFFPADGQMFGNSGGTPDHNFHFTYELHALFDYDASATNYFQFIGDDDVWVYIDGRLVIDLGGVHLATEQYVDLDRLGLVDGETYRLDFFFSERHRTQSNFRINTSLLLQSVELPGVTAAFD